MELSKEPRAKLLKWAMGNSDIFIEDDGKVNLSGIYAHLTIGQMIEFLRENVNGDWDHKPVRVTDEEVYPFTGIFADKFCLDDNMTCDNLWEAVKEVLNEPNK